MYTITTTPRQDRALAARLTQENASRAGGDTPQPLLDLAGLVQLLFNNAMDDVADRLRLQRRDILSVAAADAAPAQQKQIADLLGVTLP